MWLKVCQSRTSLQQQPCAPLLLQVKDVIRRPQPSSPTPDLPRVRGLTPTATPELVQVREFIPKLEPTTSSLGLPRVQGLKPTATAFVLELSPVGVQKHADPPLMVHGYSVEEYQKIYHSVVDEMVK